MPLGKLSKSQIEKAYSVLTELTGLVEQKASTTKILDASNRFYTLIPHDFGMKQPPLLSTVELVNVRIHYNLYDQCNHTVKLLVEWPTVQSVECVRSLLFCAQMK